MDQPTYWMIIYSDSRPGPWEERRKSIFLAQRTRRWCLRWRLEHSCPLTARGQWRSTHPSALRAVPLQYFYDYSDQTASGAQIMRNNHWFISAWDIIWKCKFDTWRQLIYWSLVTVNSACIMIRTHNEVMQSVHCSVFTHNYMKTKIVLVEKCTVFILWCYLM